MKNHNVFEIAPQRRPFIVSACEGAITRLLVILPEREVADRTSLDSYFFRFWGPLIKKIVRTDKPLVLFEVLVQEDFDFEEHIHHPHPPSEDSVVMEEVEVEADHSHPPLLYFPNTRVKKGNACGLPFLYRLIRTNLDGLRMLTEFGKHPHHCHEEDPSALYLFIKDPFIALQNMDQEVVLLEPYYSWPSLGKSQMLQFSKHLPEIISSQTDIRVRSSPFYLHGGNMLSCSRFTLIGDEIKKVNQKEFGDNMSTSDKRYQAVMKSLLGVSEILELPNYFAPWAKANEKKSDELPIFLFHLDLFLTLGGKLENGNELIYVAEPRIWDGENWKSTNNGLVQSETFAIALAKYLDGIITTLKNELKCELQIARVPLLQHGYDFYSYNNCLLEILEDGHRHVYLPTYYSNAAAVDRVCDRVSLPDFWKADKMAREEFEAPFANLCEKISVHPIEGLGLRSLGSLRASLGCITQVLSRSPAP